MNVYVNINININIDNKKITTGKIKVNGGDGSTAIEINC